MLLPTDQDAQQNGLFLFNVVAYGRICTADSSVKQYGKVRQTSFRVVNAVLVETVDVHWLRWLVGLSSAALPDQDLPAGINCQVLIRNPINSTTHTI